MAEPKLLRRICASSLYVHCPSILLLLRFLCLFVSGVWAAVASHPRPSVCTASESPLATQGKDIKCTDPVQCQIDRHLFYGSFKWIDSASVLSLCLCSPGIPHTPVLLLLSPSHGQIDYPFVRSALNDDAFRALYRRFDSSPAASRLSDVPLLPPMEAALRAKQAALAARSK